MSRWLEEFRREIAKKARRRRPLPERRFHRHAQYRVYGLTAPQFWKLLEVFRPRWMELTLDKRLALAEELVTQDVGEMGHAAVAIVSWSVASLRPGHFKVVDGLVEHVKSWSQVDHLCMGVMQPLLSAYPRECLKLAKRWSVSSNRFRRRASVVMFTRKVGASGRFTSEALRLCENLLWDPEDIVRKGVGWALKDNLRSVPKRVRYIKDLRRRGVSSTIIRYAIRDLKDSERREILKVRPSRKPLRRAPSG